MLALAVLAGVAGGWCWRASGCYARMLSAGGQADAAGLVVALLSAAHMYRRRGRAFAPALLRGRIRFCRFHWGCLFSAALLVAVCIASAARYGFTPHALLVCVAGAMLLLLALIDAR